MRLRGAGTLHADLVVDASGRGSKVPEWMEAAGWAPPPTVTLDSRLVYTSAVYKMPADWEGPQAVTVRAATGKRSGLALAHAHRQYIALAGSWLMPHHECQSQVCLPHHACSRRSLPGRQTAAAACFFQLRVDTIT